jgi:hypothetical protein
LAFCSIPALILFLFLPSFTKSLAPCPTPFLGASLVFYPNPAVHLSVLDYNSLFILFSFVGGRGTIFPGTALDYVPGGLLGESCVVLFAHLLGL